jgi:hypothetical protein
MTYFKEFLKIYKKKLYRCFSRQLGFENKLQTKAKNKNNNKKINNTRADPPAFKTTDKK